MTARPDWCEADGPDEAGGAAADGASTQDPARLLRQRLLVSALLTVFGLSNRTELYTAQDETDLKLGSVPLIVLNLNHNDYVDATGEDVVEYTRRLLANLRWDTAVARLDRLGIR